MKHKRVFFKRKCTSNTIFIWRFDFGDNHFWYEWPKHNQPKYHWKFLLSFKGFQRTLFFFFAHLYTTNNHLHTSLCLLQLRISRRRRYIVLRRVRHDSRIFYWSPKWGLHLEVFQSWKDGLPWCPELRNSWVNNFGYVGLITTNNTFMIHSWNISEIAKCETKTWKKWAFNWKLLFFSQLSIL